MGCGSFSFGAVGSDMGETEKFGGFRTIPECDVGLTEAKLMSYGEFPRVGFLMMMSVPLLESPSGVAMTENLERRETMSRQTERIVRHRVDQSECASTSKNFG